MADSIPELLFSSLVFWTSPLLFSEFNWHVEMYVRFDCMFNFLNLKQTNKQKILPVEDDPISVGWIDKQLFWNSLQLVLSVLPVETGY